MKKKQNFEICFEPEAFLVFRSPKIDIYGEPIHSPLRQKVNKFFLRISYNSPVDKKCYDFWESINVFIPLIMANGANISPQLSLCQKGQEVIFYKSGIKLNKIKGGNRCQKFYPN